MPFGSLRLSLGLAARGAAAAVSDWILAAGAWNDAGFWRDEKTWKDS